MLFLKIKILNLLLKNSAVILKRMETSSDLELSTKKVDIFRDTYVRYMGYANELGEAFRPIFARFVKPSYAVAFLYVGMDTVDKCYHHYKNNRSFKYISSHGGDVLLWQLMASVFIPGLVIKEITRAAGYGIQSISSPRFPSVLRKFGPTAIGIAAIPFIIHPIDSLVDKIMDNTYRKYVHSEDF